MRRGLSIWICWVSLASMGQSEGISLLPPHQFTEGEPVEIHLNAPEYAGMKILWRVLLENAPLASGMLSVNQKGRATLLLETPRIRSEEALPLRLLFFEVETTKALTENTLWIFPKDPLAGGKLKLKQWSINVYDPSGYTVKWLSEIGVPYERCFNVENASGSVLIIGEGLSFVKHPNLADKLRKLAEAGMSILCLQPQEGRLSLWDAETAALPEKWSFSGDHFFEEWDKRLMASGLEMQRFNLEVVRGQVCLQLNAESGWPWGAFEYAGGGSLYICGVDIVSSKIKSPAPVMLFELMLKKFDYPKKTNGEPNE